jgi:hypothetical protein
MQLCDLTAGCLGWCCKFGKRFNFKDSLSDAENHLWLDRVPIRKQLTAIHHLFHGASAEEAAELKKIKLASSVMDIYRSWTETVSMQQNEQTR